MVLHTGCGKSFVKSERIVGGEVVSDLKIWKWISPPAWRSMILPAVCGCLLKRASRHENSPVRSSPSPPARSGLTAVSVSEACSETNVYGGESPVRSTVARFLVSSRPRSRKEPWVGKRKLRGDERAELSFPGPEVDLCGDENVGVREVRSQRRFPRPLRVRNNLRPIVKTAIWLILPVVICLNQRLSHACLSSHCPKVKPRMAH